MLVGIERDIFHLLRLLSRLTPLSVSPTHTVTVRARETQRFHAIKTSSHSGDDGLHSRQAQELRGWTRRAWLASEGCRAKRCGVRSARRRRVRRQPPDKAAVELRAAAARAGMALGVVRRPWSRVGPSQ